MLFWVINAPTGPTPREGDADGQTGEVDKEVSEQGNMDGNATEVQDGGTEVEARIVKRSRNGKYVVREHVFRARL